jgi:hypothetical protein
MRQRIARRLVGLYPRAWRARYEQELLALIEETPITFGVVVDLLAGAARQRMWTIISVIDAPPVSDGRELVRDWIAPLSATLLLWLSGRLLGAGLVSLGFRTPVPYLSAASCVLLSSRVIVASVRRSRPFRRAVVRGVCLLPTELLRFTLSRSECRWWFAAIFLSAALDQTMTPAFSSFYLVFMTFWNLRHASRGKQERASALIRIRRAAMSASS